MSYQKHLSDKEVLQPYITQPSSQQSGINDNSSPNYEDMSHLTSNYYIPQHIDDSHHDRSYYDDMQGNPLYFFLLKSHNLNPQLHFKFFPVSLTHISFPQFHCRNSTSLPCRRNITPYNSPQSPSHPLS